ncbi:MAG: hypothetical protein LKH93_06345 [Clostridium beijerinckii]|uniref:hypothetical protein n=1 Tax=Clostridium beijerinckii TaxID=1520 RepID=UPI001F2F9C55|nr:hypothetical protein [Clostridium beijerinckii]MCI1578817.1 hypothetical protein [Clostridium beijerinckii]MCI1583856.1 hypothetical protein [Clostridium beijerinckii]MCI1621826.1 hypothetical protein [Clostridium beijerinckii]
MNYMGETYISARYRKDDFNNLELGINSDERDWEFAIKIFKDRIKGRYLNIVDKIISDGCLMIDGFSVMALNCLIIETLLQFKNGWDETPRRSNCEEYKKFLLQEFPEVFIDETMAHKFYTDIRCGILHSAQTKNVSQLTVNEEYIAKLINGGRGISVDVVGISRIISEYFENYIEKLKDCRNKGERYCFLKKMKYLCEK